MASSMKPLAVVTGASSGIGYELAKQFAQNDFDLLVTATGPSIDQAARDFKALGADVRSVQADLSTADGVEKLYDTDVCTTVIEALERRTGSNS